MMRAPEGDWAELLEVVDDGKAWLEGFRKWSPGPHIILFPANATGTMVYGKHVDLVDYAPPTVLASELHYVDTDERPSRVNGTVALVTERQQHTVHYRLFWGTGAPESGEKTGHAVLENMLGWGTPAGAQNIGEIYVTGWEQQRAYAIGSILLPLGGLATSQSSVWNGSSARAVDGNWAATYWAACIHTLHEDSPWWQVDLGRPTTISMIRIMIGTDRWDLLGFDVLVDKVPCAEDVTIGKGATIDVDCIATGSVVRVRASRTTELHICEFGIFALLSGATTLTHHKELAVTGLITTQSSNLHDGGGAPRRRGLALLAVDEEWTRTTYESTSCAKTLMDDHPWWQVDLGKPTSISKIRIAGWRAAQGESGAIDVVPLSDFDVLVDGVPCALGASLDEGAASVGDVECVAFGSVVKIMLTALQTELSICEFSVFSYESPRSQPYDYVGCYTGGSMTQMGLVPTTSAGVTECRQTCSTNGFEYFSFECPQEDTVLCDCGSGNLPIAGSKLDSSECAEFNIAGSQCNGPFVVSGSDSVYFLGSYDRNAMYRTTSHQAYEYAGCYSGTAADAIELIAEVPSTSTTDGVGLCRDECSSRGYAYFGFQCPQRSLVGVVSCYCYASTFAASSTALDFSKCKEFNAAGSGICDGPFVASGSLGTYYLGAGDISSIYKTSPDFLAMGDGVCRDVDGGKPSWSWAGWTKAAAEEKCLAEPRCTGYAQTQWGIWEFYCDVNDPVGTCTEVGTGGISVVGGSGEEGSVESCYVRVASLPHYRSCTLTVDAVRGRSEAGYEQEISEIEIYDHIGDLIPVASADASSSCSFSADGRPANAIDGNATTMWKCLPTGESWPPVPEWSITIYFAAPSSVGSYMIYNHGAALAPNTKGWTGWTLTCGGALQDRRADRQPPRQEGAKYREENFPALAQPRRNNTEEMSCEDFWPKHLRVETAPCPWLGTSSCEELANGGCEASGECEMHSLVELDVRLSGPARMIGKRIESGWRPGMVPPETEEENVEEWSNGIFGDFDWQSWKPGCGEEQLVCLPKQSTLPSCTSLRDFAQFAWDYVGCYHMEWDLGLECRGRCEERDWALTPPPYKVCVPKRMAVSDLGAGDDASTTAPPETLLEGQCDTDSKVQPLLETCDASAVVGGDFNHFRVLGLPEDLSLRAEVALRGAEGGVLAITVTAQETETVGPAYMIAAVDPAANAGGDLLVLKTQTELAVRDVDLTDHEMVMYAKSAGALTATRSARVPSDCPEGEDFFRCSVSTSTDDYDYCRDQRSCPIYEVSPTGLPCCFCAGCLINSAPEDPSAWANDGPGDFFVVGLLDTGSDAPALPVREFVVHDEGPYPQPVGMAVALPEKRPEYTDLNGGKAVLIVVSSNHFYLFDLVGSGTISPGGSVATHNADYTGSDSKYGIALATSCNCSHVFVPNGELGGMDIFGSHGRRSNFDLLPSKGGYRKASRVHLQGIAAAGDTLFLLAGGSPDRYLAANVPVLYQYDQCSGVLHTKAEIPSDEHLAWGNQPLDNIEYGDASMTIADFGDHFAFIVARGGGRRRGNGKSKPTYIKTYVQTFAPPPEPPCHMALLAQDAWCTTGEWVGASFSAGDDVSDSTLNGFYASLDECKEACIADPACSFMGHRADGWCEFWVWQTDGAMKSCDVPSPPESENLGLYDGGGFRRYPVRDAGGYIPIFDPTVPAAAVSIYEKQAPCWWANITNHTEITEIEYLASKSAVNEGILTRCDSGVEGDEEGVVVQQEGTLLTSSNGRVFAVSGRRSLMSPGPADVLTLHEAEVEERVFSPLYSPCCDKQGLVFDLHWPPTPGPTSAPTAGPTPSPTPMPTEYNLTALARAYATDVCYPRPSTCAAGDGPPSARSLAVDTIVLPSQELPPEVTHLFAFATGPQGMAAMGTALPIADFVPTLPPRCELSLNFRDLDMRRDVVSGVLKLAITPHRFLTHVFVFHDGVRFAVLSFLAHRYLTYAGDMSLWTPWLANTDGGWLNGTTRYLNASALPAGATASADLWTFELFHGPTEARKLTFVPMHVREGVEVPGEGRSWLLWDDAPPANLTEVRFVDVDPTIGMWAGVATLAVADTHTDSIRACEGSVCEPFAWGRASGMPDDASCEIVRAFPPANVTPIVPAKGSYSDGGANLTHCPVPDEDDPAQFVAGKASGCNPAPCIDYDQPYATLSHAWGACAMNLECSFVYRYRTGSFHLRRTSDFAFPDDPMRPDDRPLLEEVAHGEPLNPDDRLYPFPCHPDDEEVTTTSTTSFMNMTGQTITTTTTTTIATTTTTTTTTANAEEECLDMCIHECLLTSGNQTEQAMEENCTLTSIDEGTCNTTVLPPTHDYLRFDDYLRCVRGCSSCFTVPIDWSVYPRVVDEDRRLGLISFSVENFSSSADIFFVNADGEEIPVCPELPVNCSEVYCPTPPPLCATFDPLLFLPDSASAPYGTNIEHMIPTENADCWTEDQCFDACMVTADASGNCKMPHDIRPTPNCNSTNGTIPANPFCTSANHTNHTNLSLHDRILNRIASATSVPDLACGGAATLVTGPHLDGNNDDHSALAGHARRLHDPASEREPLPHRSVCENACAAEQSCNAVTMLPDGMCKFFSRCEDWYFEPGATTLLLDAALNWAEKYDVPCADLCSDQCSAFNRTEEVPSRRLHEDDHTDTPWLDDRPHPIMDRSRSEINMTTGFVDPQYTYFDWCDADGAVCYNDPLLPVPVPKPVPRPCMPDGSIVVEETITADRPTPVPTGVPTPFPTPSYDTLRWEREVGEFGFPVTSKPIAVDNVLYFGSHDHHVYAVDAATGAVVWRYKTNGTVFATPAVVDDTVCTGVPTLVTPPYIYPSHHHLLRINRQCSFERAVIVGSFDGYIYALNAVNGSKLWSFATGGKVGSSAAVHDGVVYVGSHDANLYALNATTGQWLWTFKTGGAVYSSPAVQDGVVYFGSMDGLVYAINIEVECSEERQRQRGPVALRWKKFCTPVVLWLFFTGGPVFSSPTLHGDVVYVGSHDHHVYALRTAIITATPTPAPTRRYRKNRRRRRTMAPTPAPTTPAPTPFPQAPLLWSFRTEGRVLGTPTVAGPLVMVGSNDRHLYALDAETGEKAWDFETGHWVDTAVAVGGRDVYVGSWDGKVYALEQSTGTLRSARLSPPNGDQQEDLPCGQGGQG
jgi:outer membrane protein assembly factor BamB